MIKIFKEAASDPLPCFSACVCGIAAFGYFVLCTYEWRGAVYMGKFS